MESSNGANDDAPLAALPPLPEFSPSDRVSDLKVINDENDFHSETNCLTDNPTFQFLRRFCTRQWFMVALCLYVVNQAMITVGLGAASISTIERRYNYSSTVIGILIGFFDLVVLLIVPMVSYLAGRPRTHMPRTLACGLLFISLGAFIFALPQAVGGSYSLGPNAGRSVECDSARADPALNCRASSDNLLVIFFIGQIFIAIGTAILYTVGPSYLDKIVPKLQLSLYLGIFYSMAAIGPAIGFIVAGSFLSNWVDPGKKPAGVTARDPDWVGAWWAGYVLAGFLAIIVSMPLFLYPRFVPGSRTVRAHNVSVVTNSATEMNSMAGEKRKSPVDDLPVSVVDMEHRKSAAPSAADSHSFWSRTKRIVTNKTWLFNCVAQALEGFAVSGFGAWVTKVCESMFGLEASVASFSIGLVIIPGSAGGTFFGGWLMKKLRAHSLNTARWIVVFEVISTALVAILFIGCATQPIRGITTPYVGGPALSGINFNAPCNSNCRCDRERFEPYCGADEKVFFSPCYAGCVEDPFIKDRFVNCTCVDTPLASATMSRGLCSSGCDKFGPFLVALFFLMFFQFAAVSPAVTVSLRSVAAEDRSYGLGLQNSMYRILGAVPGPIAFGAALDQSCILRAFRCNSELDNCLVYETTDLRQNFFLLGFLPKLAALTCYIISYYSYRKVFTDHESSAPEVAIDTAASPSSEQLSSSKLNAGP